MLTDATTAEVEQLRSRAVVVWMSRNTKTVLYRYFVRKQPPYPSRTGFRRGVMCRRNSVLGSRFGSVTAAGPSMGRT